MMNDSVGLYADMIIGRIILIHILIRIEGNANGWLYPFEAHAFTGSTNAGTDWLKYKHHSICATITASQEDIEPEVKGISQIDLIGIPHTSTLKLRLGGQCITVTAVPCGGAVHYILSHC